MPSCERGYSLGRLAPDGPNRWQPGDEIVYRQVWRETPWLIHPVRVVLDSEELLALYIPEGTKLESPPGSWPWDGGHPWARGDGRWKGHGALILHHPGDAFTVWAFWRGPERAFAGWYVNLQEPLRRTADGVDTCDQELDIVIALDGSWSFKDDELMEPWIKRGRFTAEEVAAIRSEGARVARRLDAGERWWDESWSAWRPDPSWTVP